MPVVKRPENLKQNNPNGEIIVIITEQLSGYIKSFEPDLPGYLSKIENYGINNEVPIIKKDAQSVLRFMIKTLKPIRILEIGTAIGFSACYMAEYMPYDAEIYTIEKVPARIEVAKKNFSESKFRDRIHLLEGDAAEILKNLAEEGKEFDFVFLDAAKAQYNVYLEYINILLKKDGVLLTDSILQEGSVADSKFSITRRDRTIHQRMREYISGLMNSNRYHSMIIPIGDGMLISYKNFGGSDDK